MSFIVYKTTCLVTGRFYIGKHDDSNPGYLGSGKLLKLSVAKHGVKNHLREILSRHDDEAEAYAEEIKQIEIHRIEYPDLCMNLAIGGIGGQSGYKHGPPSLEHRNKISAAKMGHRVSESTREKISASLKGKLVGDLHPFAGKTHTEESRMKIGKAFRGRVWITNGKESKLTHPDIEMPVGWRRGRTTKRTKETTGQ